MKYFSMFSGIGGFELGITKAFEKGHRSSQDIRPGHDEPRPNGRLGRESEQRSFCIGYSEIDKPAIRTYERHFNHPNFGDATTIDAAGLPDFELMVGGFPCQAFSVAGKRKGFDDTRGTLFFDIARVLSHKRPRHLLLENVFGLLSHGQGKTFDKILGVLADLGYRCEWQVLNSKHYGVPQNRERVFIVGHLRGECGQQVFPIFGDDGQDTQPPSQISATLRARDYANWNGNYVTGQPGDGQEEAQPDPDHADRGAAHPSLEPYGTSQDQKINPIDGISQTLSSGHFNQPKIATRQPLRYLDRNQKNIEGDYAYTVDASQTSGVAVAERIRRLTPVECERLQGFPDNWTAGESDTQRYKMLGNAVTVNVVKAIMGRFKCLEI